MERWYLCGCCKGLVCTCSPSELCIYTSTIPLFSLNFIFHLHSKSQQKQVIVLILVPFDIMNQ